MAENIENRLQSLRTQQQESARRHAQAEAKLDTVLARKTQLLEGLHQQGFKDPEAAREEVIALSAEVEEILDQIEARVQGS